MKGAVSGSCNAGRCTYDSPLAVASCDPGKKKVVGTIHILGQHSFELFITNYVIINTVLNISKNLDLLTQFFC